jgi:hypothetical protein
VVRGVYGTFSLVPECCVIDFDLSICERRDLEEIILNLTGTEMREKLERCHTSAKYRMFEKE